MPLSSYVYWNNYHYWNSVFSCSAIVENDMQRFGKPKMLILDNKPRRLRALFHKLSYKYDVTLAQSVKEFLRKLAENDYEFISLEHDLSESFEDPDSNQAGMAVVRYLEKTGWPANKPKPRIYVHTCNIFAAYLMVTQLNAMNFFAEWTPFEYDHQNSHLA